MDTLNSKKAGLVLGILFALIHLLWIILVWVGVAKILMDWILAMHFMEMAYTITAVGFWKAIALLVMTFIFGYVCGWVFAVLHNWLSKSKVNV